MNLNDLLEVCPHLAGPFEDEGVTNEEYQLAVALMETGMFSGEVPAELMCSLLAMVPGANPAV